MQYRFVGLVLFLPLALLLGCSAGEDVNGAGNHSARSGRTATGGEQASPQAISVKASRALSEPISTYIVSNTTIEPIRKVAVYAKLDAIIEEIFTEEGVAVRQGDGLLHLEDREIRNKHEQADIAVGQAKVQLEQAEVKAALSAADHARAQDLFEQKLISKQEFDQASLSNRTDRLGYSSAQQQYETALAQLRASTIQMEYAEVLAPIDGVITERLVEAGDRVNSNQEVFSIEEFPPLWARIFVPERQLPELRVGQEAKIIVETYPDEEFLSQIKMISPTIDATSGTVKVTLEMQEAKRLRPGMFGTVYIATETREAAVVIPKRALLRERDANRVFVITPNNLVEKRDVILGFTEENRVEIAEGIQPGEAVVTVGQEGLADGYAVNILSWEGASHLNQPQQAFSPPPSNPLAAVEASNEPSRRSQVSPQNGNVRPGAENRRRISPERMDQMMNRLLARAEVRKEYESRLANDPELATNFDKKAAFAQEMMGRFGNRGASQRP